MCKIVNKCEVLKKEIHYYHYLYLNITIYILKKWVIMKIRQMKNLKGALCNFLW